MSQGVQESAPSVLMVFPTHFSQIFMEGDLYVPAEQGSENGFCQKFIYLPINWS